MLLFFRIVNNSPGPRPTACQTCAGMKRKARPKHGSGSKRPCVFSCFIVFQSFFLYVFLSSFLSFWKRFVSFRTALAGGFCRIASHFSSEGQAVERKQSSESSIQLQHKCFETCRKSVPERAPGQAKSSQNRFKSELSKASIFA